jgi:hypothetical protein
LMLNGKPVRLSKAKRDRWEVLLAMAESIQNGSNTNPKSQGPFDFGLLQDIINRLSCKSCHKIIRGDLSAHELVCENEESSICVDCGERFEVPEILVHHYRSAHGCDIKQTTVERRWAERNPHLFPQLDLHTGYGRYLTTRSPVSGRHADEEVKQLWIDFTANPAVFEGGRKWTLLDKHREAFESLFDATPVRFHHHVSDISPPSLHSLLQAMATYSDHTPEILDECKAFPNFACTLGSYGSSYGAGANNSSLLKTRQTACGTPYIEIKTNGKAAYIEKQLKSARRKGCFALITEIVRWKDGRVMPPTEWSNIYKACKLAGVVLIVDETLTLLRCGKPFAFQHAEYAGRPDVVFFGKGLIAAGVALSWKGSWLSQLKLTKESIEESYTDLQNVSDVLETGIAIRSLGIMRLALREEWAARSIRIGKYLREFAEEGYRNQARKDLKVDGLGCLLYFNTQDILHHWVRGAGAGPGNVRWIPVLDDNMEDPAKLREKFFGPLSITHRKLLGRRMAKLGMIPEICSGCGDYSPREGVVFCSQCCITICGTCKEEVPHECLLSTESSRDDHFKRHVENDPWIGGPDNKR